MQSNSFSSNMYFLCSLVQSPSTISPVQRYLYLLWWVYSACFCLYIVDVTLLYCPVSEKFIWRPVISALACEFHVHHFSMVRENSHSLQCLRVLDNCSLIISFWQDSHSKQTKYPRKVDDFPTLVCCSRIYLISRLHGISIHSSPLFTSGYCRHLQQKCGKLVYIPLDLRSIANANNIWTQFGFTILNRAIYSKSN